MKPAKVIALTYLELSPRSTHGHHLMLGGRPESSCGLPYLQPSVGALLHEMKDELTHRRVYGDSLVVEWQVLAAINEWGCQILRDPRIVGYIPPMDEGERPRLVSWSKPLQRRLLKRNEKERVS